MKIERIRFCCQDYNIKKMMDNDLDFIDLFILDYIRNLENGGYFNDFKMFVKINYDDILKKMNDDEIINYLKTLSSKINPNVTIIAKKLGILVTKEFLLTDSVGFSYTGKYLELLF